MPPQETFLNSTTYLVIKDLAYFAIALAGVIIAGKGLSTWKKQIAWKVEYETARRLYKAVLNVREAISHVRNPWIPISEQAAAEEKYPNVEKGRTTAVYYMRWEKMTEAMAALDLEEIEAEVLWDSEASKKIKPLRACVAKLTVTITNFLRPHDHPAKIHTMDTDIIYEMRNGDERDAFTKEVDAAIKEVGDFLKPKYRLST